MSFEQVLIVGGGIAGLATAVGLSRSGIPCEVVERAIESLGDGIGAGTESRGQFAAAKPFPCNESYQLGFIGSQAVDGFHHRPALGLSDELEIGFVLRRDRQTDRLP